MAEDEQAETEETPEDNQDIVIEQEASSSEEGVQLSAEGFPIEGESKWVTILRLMAVATLVTIGVIGAMFHFLTADDSFIESQQLAMMMGGIVFLLVLEYFVFLLVVIPRQADYGRYAIHETKVEFFPLTALGLAIGNKSETVHIERFAGVASSKSTDKKGKLSYAVYLVHSDNKGKTINIKSFPSAEEADNYAQNLGRKLRLNFVSGARKSRPKKRAI